MSRQEKQPEEKKDDVPLWLVSFTDMITLLLSFFILLQTFAHEQRPELFFEGRGAFVRAFRSMGLPIWLMGKQKRVERDWFAKRYPVAPDPEQRRQNQIDAEMEELQKIYQQLKQEFDTQTRDITETTVHVTVAPFTFGNRSADLPEAAVEFLDAQVLQWQSILNPETTTIYIVGLGQDGVGSQEQFVLAARRAEAVRRYLLQRLPRLETPWEIRAWGAGTSFGSLPEETQIGIIVMGAEHGG
jgi:outer membrane protein OmpA-like peptidoglycan-associated protein